MQERRGRPETPAEDAEPAEGDGSTPTRGLPAIRATSLSGFPLLSIDLPLNAYVPEEYVPGADLRLRLYRRMAQVTSLAGVDAIAQELQDRFGELPEPVSNLIFLLRLKVLAALAGVEGIFREGQMIVLRLPEADEAERKRLQQRLGTKGRVGRSQVWINIRGDSAWREDVHQVLERMVSNA